MIGAETFDDAGVYQLREDLAIVQTVDFFTPVVDDPLRFGQIAAANALSDVYAMGGKPITALNLVGFPVETLDLSVLAEILKGGGGKVHEAGAALVGGHTVEDPELKYGLAVTGIVHPAHVRANSTARPGDWLILTKPLGIGLITTALKNEAAPPELVNAAVVVMATLNAAAAEAMQSVDAHACTDVTGFGLLGHAYEMASASRVGIEIDASAVPVLPGSEALVAAGHVCGGSRRNRRYLEPHVTYAENVSEAERVILCDAITSGGLLIAAAPAAAEAIVARLAPENPWVHCIGRVVADHPGHLLVRP